MSTSRLLAFAGHKQAGKTTASNFLHGYQLRANDVIDGFDILTDGRLVITTSVLNHNGEEEQTKGFLEVGRNDPDFADWAAYNMWPFIKKYSFASPLKEIAVELFSLQRENVYGNEAKKNTATFFRWEDMPGIITSKEATRNKATKKLISDGVLKYHAPGKMTHREFLQFFGTDVCRKIYDEIWFTKLLNDVDTERPLIAIVDDCRFINEVESIQKTGGKVIYLRRSPHEDSHSSESELDGYRGFDAVIDNSNLSIHETNIQIISALDDWGWLEKSVQQKPQKNNSAELVGGIHKIKE